MIPVSYSTQFYTTFDKYKRDDMSSAPIDISDASSSTACRSILLEAKIRLHLNPSCALVTCRIAAPGEIRTNYQGPMNDILESIHLTLDMDVLYHSIMKECRYLSKLILTNIVGRSTLDYSRKLGPNPRADTISSSKKSSSSYGMLQSTVALPCDSVTHSTVATSSDDFSFEEMRKNVVLNHKSSNKLQSPTNCHISISEEESSGTTISVSENGSNGSMRSHRRGKKNILKWLAKKTTIHKET